MTRRTRLKAQDDPDEPGYCAAVSPKEARAQDIETIETESDSSDATDGKSVSFSQLFAYADSTDYALMTIGTLSALAAGTGRPIQVLFFGDALNAFNPSVDDPGELRAQVNVVARNFTIAGVAVLLFCFLYVVCWSYTASRQAKRIQRAYVHGILTKEIGWFDVNNPMELPTRAAEATLIIQAGMGRKIGDALYSISLAVSGMTISFTKGWKLTLIVLAFVPFIVAGAIVSIKLLAKATQAMIKSYGKAGAVAQEALSNVRTVHMFNSIHHFVDKYEKALDLSLRAGIRRGLTVGWGAGLPSAVLLCATGCGLYFGGVFVANDRRDGCEGSGCYDGGRVITVFYGVVMAASALGQAAPSIQAVFAARAAAFDVFRVIDQPSLIDPSSDNGKKLDKVVGQVEIENVSFAYPSRPDVQVCRNYSLTIEAGQTVALVGPSGSGKSTVVSLLERFYDPLSGTVKLDGVNVRDLNVAWLRQQIGLVGQEPVLFATSIMENIRHGQPKASDEQVFEAAKMANAYTFIKDFPDGFHTDVGGRGAQMSGGQKQRIAIARAILKSPSILLLDEATSALDSESERIVQESLDQLLASSRRTTIIVAHRLSTIRHADKIAVHSQGAIVEVGTHEELMALSSGHYRQLVEAQNRVRDPKREMEDEVAEDHSSKGRVSSFRVMERTTSRHSAKLVDNEVDDDKTSPHVPALRIWKMSFPEWKYLVLGMVGALVNSSVFPFWGLFLSKLAVLFYEPKPHGELIDSARNGMLGFIGLGVAFLISHTVQHYSFSVVSQHLIIRVRLATFQAMLRQEIGWHDLDENSAGALTSKLATDTAILQGMTSDMLNQRLVVLTSIGIGLGIGFYQSWQMTLLMLATIPLFVFTGLIQAQLSRGTLSNRIGSDAEAAAGSILSESIESIRTVASFNMENNILAMYDETVHASTAAETKAGMMGGAALGSGQSLIFFNVAFLFYVGGIWVSHHTITFEDMITVIVVIMFATFSLGFSGHDAADAGKAKIAGARIFALIDREPAIDATSTEGAVVTQLNGDINFENIAFTYPSRPDAKIYRNYSLRIRAGQTVALVGASGSGKSTAISLLERFYDPAHGRVTIDGADLRSLQLPWLRERISLVSQEPVLFIGTIAENIALGKPGATRAEVIEAAMKANAFDFINNFPNGFDTDVGDRGAQVSGGQKQRIAIARAILRDPEVLLLDEATSALDNESERIVQESLDRLMSLKKRTTIIVAHRLSTIRYADLIAVTQDGAIVEQGTHEQLMMHDDGIYRRLVTRQMHSDE